MDTFGQRLKKARKDSGLTQVEISAKCGAYQSKYKNWESDINEPDIATIVKLAEILGVSTDWLLGLGKQESNYPNEYNREIHYLAEDAAEYGPEAIKKLRKMIPIMFEKKGK